MASGEQLKALLKAHADGDDDRFFSVAMQVAAQEARRGHGRLAEDLRTLIDRAKSGPGPGRQFRSAGLGVNWRTSWRPRTRARGWER